VCVDLCIIWDFFCILGDPAKLYRMVHERIFSLPDHFLVYPAHDYSGIFRLIICWRVQWCIRCMSWNGFFQPFYWNGTIQSI